VDVITDDDSVPATDFHCPLVSLPLAFGTTAATIPVRIPYIKADPHRVAQWAHRLADMKSAYGDPNRPCIGLAWAGNPAHTNAHNRDVLLAELMRVLPDTFQFVSLQKDLSTSDMTLLSDNRHILNFTDELRDFADTAALCECMRVVISVDTSVAHLSGALGKDTWILCPFNPDWRWLLQRSDSPWYPTVRVYRQSTPGTWTTVLERVRDDFRSLR